MFYLSKAAAKHMKPGGAIINTASINAKSPNPTLLAYATTKGAIANFTAGLAQLLAKEGIRVNCVAPGPIWTPLIPSTMEEELVEKFGKNTPLGRAGQPAELAPAYVLLASRGRQLHDRRNGPGNRRPPDVVAAGCVLSDCATRCRLSRHEGDHMRNQVVAG